MAELSVVLPRGVIFPFPSLTNFSRGSSPRRSVGRSFPPPPPRPYFLARVCCHVYMLSVRTHAGCSVSIVIDRKEACNRGKGSFVILIMSVRS